MHTKPYSVLSKYLTYKFIIYYLVFTTDTIFNGYVYITNTLWNRTENSYADIQLKSENVPIVIHTAASCFR